MEHVKEWLKELQFEFSYQNIIARKYSLIYLLKHLSEIIHLAGFIYDCKSF